MSNSNRFWPVWSQSPARRVGWYVQDLQRSTKYAVVFVGDRHATRLEADTEARRLEVEHLAKSGRFAV